jgi:hypothetical protein
MDEQTRAQQRTTQAVIEAPRVAGQLVGLGTEALTVWADVTQKALRDMLQLSSQATQEGARQLADWQQANVDLLREMQTAMFRWHTMWPEALRDPIHSYQRALEEAIDGTQRIFELTRRNAEAATSSCQRLERAAEDASRTLGETFRQASSRMHEVYARSDRLRAA